LEGAVRVYCEVEGGPRGYLLVDALWVRVPAGSRDGYAGGGPVEWFLGGGVPGWGYV